MNRRLLVVLAVAGAVTTGTAAVLALFAHDFQPYEPAEKLAQVITAAIWIVAGLIAWQRQPDNMVGPLMTALGFLELLPKLYWDASVPFTISELVSFFTLPVFLTLLLAYPSGRLASRFERSFIVVTGVMVLVLSPVVQLFWDPRGTDCPECPRNLLLLDRDQQVWAIVSPLGDLVLAGVLATGVVLFVSHIRRASPPMRRAFGPVLLAAAASAVTLGVVVLMDAAGAVTEGTLPLWLADVAYAAIPIAFLGGLLRMRWHRIALADLVVELRARPPAAGAREPIARALGDPSLELAFWLPDEGRFVDADGDPVELGDLGPGRAVTLLEHEGNRVAALVHDPSLNEDPALMEAVGAAASLALENSRLQAELRAQLAEVRASRARIVSAGDAERRRLERDLHDGAQQRLLGVRLALRLAREHLAEEVTARDLMAEADAEVVAALEELRSLARGIHPAILTEEGLAPALRELARRAPMPVELRTCAGRLPAPVEATSYFVAAEALANVVKHASAGHATIDVARRNGCLVVAVTDDGVGGADLLGDGLRGLRDRVESLDGQLVVDSPAGRGTRVSAAIPCG